MYYWYEILFMQIMTWTAVYILSNRFNIRPYEHKYAARLVIAFTFMAIGLRLIFGPPITMDIALTINYFQQMIIACTLWTIIYMQLTRLTR